MIQYDGNSYWDYPTIQKWCFDFCNEHSEWASLETIGHTREGRPIFVVTLGADPKNHPCFWLDGGTHATEWTGVMATIFALSEWGKELATSDGQDWFRNHAICVLPCISPDGYQWTHEGKALLRSSTRPPRPGTQMNGLMPQDINGDGRISYMRWKDPSGPFVFDDSAPMGMRFRKIQDDPQKACFLAREGLFMNWDGIRWTQAPLAHGLDLNRNFPVHWNPFRMGGMDSGDYALSEPESRAVVEAVHQRTGILVALTNHTYTGALLTQPYREDCPLSKNDIKLMQNLGKQAVQDTTYKVMQVYPEFTYDNDNPIIGVWADCLSTTFGIPGYTLELWDPFGFSEVKDINPSQFFSDPDQETVMKVLKAVSEESPIPWTRFEHPQLGEVELGGFEYLKTVRNPPERLLPQECKDGFRVAQALRYSLPKIKVSHSVDLLSSDMFRVQVTVENQGYLSTTGLERGASLKLAKGVDVRIESTDLTVVDGENPKNLGVLEGWGNLQVGGAIMPIYPKLSTKGHRGGTHWIVEGHGILMVHWDAGRAGSGSFTIQI